MRERALGKPLSGGSWLVATVIVLASGCGPRQPADDASTASSETKSSSSEGASGDKTSDNAGEKWEGATTEDLQARQAGPPAGLGASSTSVASGSGAGSHRTDTYDKEATEVVLKRAARQVKANCGMATDDNGKANGPWGKTTIAVTLGHNGHSKGATIPPPFEGKPTGKCAMQAFSILTFPPWAGGDTTVEWEIEIPQPGK